MPDVELKKIQPNRLNPRLRFSKAGLDELADSIKQVGILEPILVRPVGDVYEVVVGERRYRAAQQAGLAKVPVTIGNYSDDEVLELNLIENVQRENLSAVEKAKVCKQLIERFPDKYPNWAKLSERIGVHKDTTLAWARTLDLPESVQALIAPREIERVPPGKIDYQTAVRIARTVKEPEKQAEVAEKFAEEHIPWRARQQVLREIAKKPEQPVEQIIRQTIEEAPIFLPFSKAHADAILDEIKTQTSRKAKDTRLRPGVIVQAQVTHFADLEVTDVYRKKLGDFDDKDARREGGYTLDEFKEVWKALHGEWTPNEAVYVIRFRVARVDEASDSSR
jgi:ParB family chromosome partitioning protein